MPAIPAPTLQHIGTALRELGVTPPDGAVESAIARAASLEAGAEDVVEMLFSRLRATRIELHAEPALLGALLGGFVPGKPLSLYANEIPQPVRDVFRMVVGAIFDDFGIVPPEVVWVAAPDLPPRTLSVKINDAPGSPVAALADDELLVNTHPGTLAALGIPVRAMTNPATGAEATVVAARGQAVFEKAGFTFWTPAGFAALVLYGEVRRQLPRLLGIEDAEYLLSQLAAPAPDLVAAVCGRFPIGDVTRVLRGLLREGVSIRNLAAILDRLLQFDTVPADSPDEIIFDDRLPVPADSAPHWTRLREFVRGGLKEQLTFSIGRGQANLPVIVLDRTIEARLPAAPLDESEARAFVSGVQKLLAQTPPPCALLANPLTRAACRELLARDLPLLPVLAYSELTPEANLQVLGQASL